MTHTFEAIPALPPGSLTEHFVSIGALASGAPIRIPLIVARGRKSGPCLWISGQVHGDELNGVFAAIDFVRGLPLDELAGTVVVSSTANPMALDVRQRRTPQDWLDLDQSFPGHANGSISERIAHALNEIIRRHADILVSMHTTMASFDAVVFAAYKVPPQGSGVSEKTMLTCMAQFSPAFVCVMPDFARAGDTTGFTHGSIDYQMLRIGKPAFLIELGGGGRYDPDHVRQGIDGLTGTAALFGLIERTPKPHGRLLRVGDFRSVTTGKSGLFRASRRPGLDELKAGEPYGQIIDLHGRIVDEPAFDRSARLIAVRRDPVVHSGDRLSLAAFDDEMLDL